MKALKIYKCKSPTEKLSLRARLVWCQTTPLPPTPFSLPGEAEPADEETAETFPRIRMIYLLFIVLLEKAPSRLYFYC